MARLYCIYGLKCYTKINVKSSQCNLNSYKIAVNRWCFSRLSYNVKAAISYYLHILIIYYGSFSHIQFLLGKDLIYIGTKITMLTTGNNETS